MTEIHAYSSDVAFTPVVKAIQARKGSREAYAHVEHNGGWRTEVDDRLKAFLAESNSLFFATASADGQPYISTAADRRDSSMCSTTRRWPSLTTAATSSSSPRAISRRIRKRTSS